MDNTKPVAHHPKNLSEKVGLAVFLALYVFAFIFDAPRIIFDRYIFLWIQVVMYGLLGISGVFLFRHTFVIGFQNWKNAPLKNIFWLLGAYVGGIVLMQIASLPAYMMGIEALQNDYNVLIAVQMMGIPLSILIIGLAGPITEEVIYRAFLLKKRKFPLWLCIILSSALFALAHMHELSVIEFISILPHFSTALVYGVLYVATENITLPLFIHVMNNTASVILLNSNV
jgi:membrane protease YdiL (CAAX protease family)